MTSNVHWKKALDRDAFIAILKDDRPAGEWEPQICVLLKEAHPSVLAELAREIDIPISRLEALFRELPPLFQSRHGRDLFEKGVINNSKYC